MLGNVWEWCHDGKRMYTVDEAIDPMGRTGARVRRIIRSSSWIYSAHFVRAAHCLLAPAHDRYVYLGFRCARSGDRGKHIS